MSAPRKSKRASRGDTAASEGGDAGAEGVEGVAARGCIHSSLEGSCASVGKYCVCRSSRKVVECGSRAGAVDCGQWMGLGEGSGSEVVGASGWSVSMGLTGGGITSSGLRGCAGGGSGISSSMSEFDADTLLALGEGDIECFTAEGSSPSS
jgi:hypothetical protein